MDQSKFPAKAFWTVQKPIEAYCNRPRCIRIWTHYRTYPNESMNNAMRSGNEFLTFISTRVIGIMAIISSIIAGISAFGMAKSMLGPVMIHI